MEYPGYSKCHADTAAGIFLVPNGNVNVIGTSAGWIVSGQTVTTTGCEFHYLYRDRHYTPQSTESRNLRFTNYKGMKDTEGNEIGLDGRTFPFSLYETDSSYNTTGANKIETIDSDENATVNFTSIEYTEDMVNAHADGDFYYVKTVVSSSRNVVKNKTPLWKKAQ